MGRPLVRKIARQADPSLRDGRGISERALLERPRNCSVWQSVSCLALERRTAETLERFGQICL